jgi:hypothetical protein
MLPRSLADMLPAAEESASFSIGPAGCYLCARGADLGTWCGGVQARLHFLWFLAGEAARIFHQNRSQDDAVGVTQYFFQLAAFLYIIPDGPIRPYILDGVGWYYAELIAASPSGRYSLTRPNRSSGNIRKSASS